MRAAAQNRLRGGRAPKLSAVLRIASGIPLAPNSRIFSRAMPLARIRDAVNTDMPLSRHCTRESNHFTPKWNQTEVSRP
jgi:hypothetical protein